MNTQEIIALLKEQKHEKIKVAIVDIDGVARGKFMSKEKFISALESEFGFCQVVFGWDINDKCYDNVKVTGWHTGYGDMDAKVDTSTFRTIPWEDDVPFFLADFDTDDKSKSYVCPRTLLKKVITQAKGMNFKPLFSQEFEWFNYRETSTSLYEKNFQNLQPITSGMFGYSLLKIGENDAYFSDLFDLMNDFNIPLEGLHTETGPGVTEAAIQYGDILEAADRAVLFKLAAKQIGFKHGIIPSFMAKQISSLPGCSGHVHQSLWDLEKKNNLFYDANSENEMSDIMKSYIAGQLLCLPEILPMFAPTINSYKRLVEGAWAPTNLTWGIDNRTTALRVLATGKKSTRIEHRVVGSDTNSYLAMAAALASGLYGIKKGLKLDTPATVGNGYEDYSNGSLPKNLWDASQEMKNSEIAKELFGEDFVDHFTKTREWEWREFAKEVTDWETKRYFEIV
ncbi:glutamine synthetase family protein [Flavivirga spongiicola]|uniref:Glutamine synthetase family protein n=1 Tax=Flavivirga spongiicola TaxID=421621 RepID=A0ABU7XYK0_9FLAO|nr:glutamine synthetase family protein [Flavivirga sp. MEBiC05379]MDO5980858.1 glutamine synthetase family protein [Flavivirga sp. MEBiC05379]